MENKFYPVEGFGGEGYIGKFNPTTFEFIKDEKYDEHMKGYDLSGFLHIKISKKPIDEVFHVYSSVASFPESVDNYTILFKR